jgi:hypothetical protein
VAGVIVLRLTSARQARAANFGAGREIAVQSFDFRIEDDRSNLPDRARVPLNSLRRACEMAEKMVHDHPHYRRVEIYCGNVWLFAASRPGAAEAPAA